MFLRRIRGGRILESLSCPQLTDLQTCSLGDFVAMFDGVVRGASTDWNIDFAARIGRDGQSSAANDTAYRR
jgi:hypothetical protein